MPQDGSGSDRGIVGLSSEPSIVPLRLYGIVGTAALGGALRAAAEAGGDLRSITQTLDHLLLLVPASSRAGLPALVARLRDRGIVREATIGGDAAPVSVVAPHPNARPGIAARMFRALSREGIDSECLNTSEARIWCLVGDRHRRRALAALHDEFVEELMHTGRPERGRHKAERAGSLGI